MTINFYLHNDKKSKNPEKQIYCYVRLHGKVITLKIDERINPSQWNAEKQQARISYTGAPELNSMLTSIKQHIQKAYRHYIENEPKADFEALKVVIQRAFNEKLGKTDDIKTFHEVYKTFLAMRKSKLSVAMIKKFQTLQNHIIDFEKHSNYKVSFKNLDMMFFDLFQNYLIEEKKHTANTLSKDFDLLRTFLKWSVERKFCIDMTFEKFKTKTEKVDVLYLNQNEIDSITQLNLTNKPSLERVRDVFLFACHTGLRFSDVSSLQRESIKNGTLHLRVQKTKEIIQIPLLDVPLAILKRYETDPQPLPVVSSQKTNQHIKTICELANITDPIQSVVYRGHQKIEETLPKCELVSFHTARRTFVTLSLEKGMRPETIMKITGHQDYKTFKKYINITSKVTENELKKMWNKPQLVDLAI